MNIFDETNVLHVDCLRYCFMRVIQAELGRIAEHWNLHEIRQQKHSNIPSGNLSCSTTYQKYLEAEIMVIV